MTWNGGGECNKKKKKKRRRRRRRRVRRRGVREIRLIEPRRAYLGGAPPLVAVEAVQGPVVAVALGVKVVLLAQGQSLDHGLEELAVQVAKGLLLLDEVVAAPVLEGREEGDDVNAGGVLLVDGDLSPHVPVVDVSHSLLLVHFEDDDLGRVRLAVLVAVDPRELALLDLAENSVAAPPVVRGLRTRARKICETLLVARSWMGLKASLLQSCSMRASTTFLGHESVAKGRGQGGAPSWATVTLGDIPLSVCVCVCWARVGAVVVAEGRRSYLIPLQRDGGARALPPPCPAFPLPPDGRRATHPSERADGRGRPPPVGGNEATADDTIRRFLELEFNQSKEEKGLERCVSAKARFKCINCIVQAHVKISPRKIDLITYDPFGSATAIKL